MKKTRHIEGALLLSVALIALQGCSRNEYTRRCADAQGNILPDSGCAPGRVGGGIYPGWIYTNGSTRWSGNRVTGGYERTAPNATIRSSSGTTISTPRGGIGGSGRGFSVGA